MSGCLVAAGSFGFSSVAFCLHPFPVVPLNWPPGVRSPQIIA